VADELYVSPHPDGLLLFMNPDVERAIRAGRAVRAVYLTSGEDQQGLPAARDNEERTQSAFAAMANVADTWQCRAEAHAGKEVRSCWPEQRPNLGIDFLELPDGTKGVLDLWGRSVGPLFVVEPVASLTTLDGGQVYTREALIAVLAAIMSETGASLVASPTGNTTYGTDHEDAVATGAFVLEASHRYAAPHASRVYRGYNIYQDWDPLPLPTEVNLSSAEHDDKARIVRLVDGQLGEHDMMLFDEWCWRQYGISEVVAPRAGRLQAGSGGCLSAAPSANRPSTTPACDAAAATTWSFDAQQRLQASDNRCLAVATDDRSVELVDCADDPRQRWTLLESGQMVGSGAACLTDAGPDPPAVSVCDSDRSVSALAAPAQQRWSFH
jgi:LmbE family N-acetylglucosaminyl deacetylase